MHKIQGLYYVVSFIKHTTATEHHGFAIQTNSNLSGYTTYETAVKALKALDDKYFPCTVVQVKETFDRVAPPPVTELETQTVDLDPWDVLA